MTLDDHKITYRSMNEAIADLRQMLPVLETGKLVAESGQGPQCPPELYKKICSALVLLRDEQALAARLAAGRRSDGSVEFRFTPEAWEMLSDPGGLNQ